MGFARQRPRRHPHYTADADVVYKGENKRASDDTAATNVFEDAKGDITYLSRADHFANYEEATAAPASAELGEPYVSEYHLNSNFDKTTYLNDKDVMPTTGADNGLTLYQKYRKIYEKMVRLFMR